MFRQSQWTDRHKTSVLTCTYSAGALIRRVCKFSVCKFASASSGKENGNILDAVLRKTTHEMNTNVTKANCSVFDLLYTFYLFIWRLLFKKILHLWTLKFFSPVKLVNWITIYHYSIIFCLKYTRKYIWSTISLKEQGKFTGNKTFTPNLSTYKYYRSRNDMLTCAKNMLCSYLLPP